MSSFHRGVAERRSGLCLYGLAPPKRTTPEERLATIAQRQAERIGALQPDGVVIYDIQDEADRIEEPRPFPFLPTLDPELYARDHLGTIDATKIVYRSVGSDTEETLRAWLRTMKPDARAVVLVGSPVTGASVNLSLRDAYRLTAAHAPELPLGGIAIAERHARRLDEQDRLLAKMDRGCRFFITQAVYDVTATKSLLSDYQIALAERGRDPAPLLLTFSPCASQKTLEFMKWLGISFPRWLDNELRLATDPLATSLELCETIFDEALEFARAKGIPIGINVESISIRKAEIEASVELFRSLRARFER